MKKVYFASTDWATSQKLLEDYKYQTPNNLGIWEDLQGTSNIDEADIIIIQDYTKEKDKLGIFK